MVPPPLAIIDGAIDIYPDYTGDALANVLKKDPITDPQKTWEAVRDVCTGRTWAKQTYVGRKKKRRTPNRG